MALYNSVALHRRVVLHNGVALYSGAAILQQHSNKSIVLTKDKQKESKRLKLYNEAIRFLAMYCNLFIRNGAVY